MLLPGVTEVVDHEQRVLAGLLSWACLAAALGDAQAPEAWCRQVDRRVGELLEDLHHTELLRAIVVDRPEADVSACDRQVLAELHAALCDVTGRAVLPSLVDFLNYATSDLAPS